MNIRELLIKIGVDSKGVTPEIDKIDRQTEKLKDTFLSVGNVLKAVFAVASLRGLIQMADDMQNLQSRIGAATESMSTANAQLNDLVEHANANRMSINDYAGSWAQFNVGMQRLGFQTADTTKLVDGLSAAFRVNGTQSATAAGALFQLTQSISGGMVQMEELNSLADAAPQLYVAVAESIGGTTTAFKKMVSDSKVSSKQLADAIIKQTEKYIKQLKDMPMTLGDVWTVVTNDVKVGINNLNDATSVIPRTAKVLMDAWEGLKKRGEQLTKMLGGPGGLIDTLVNMATPLATVIGLFYSFKALAFLASPIGMVLGLAAAIGLLYDDYKTWKDGGESLIDWAKWEPAIQQAIQGIDWIIEKFKDITGATSDIEAGFNALAITIGGVWATRFTAAVLAAFNMAGAAAKGTPLGAIIFGSAALGQVVFNAADNFGKEQWGDKIVGSGLTERRQGSWVDKAFNVGGAVADWLNSTGVRWNTRSPGYEVPKTLPAAGGGNVTNNISAPVSATVNITQLPGESTEALSERVIGDLNKLRDMSGINANNLRDVNGDVK